MWFLNVNFDFFYSHCYLLCSIIFFVDNDCIVAVVVVVVNAVVFNCCYCYAVVTSVV